MLKKSHKVLEFPHFLTVQPFFYYNILMNEKFSRSEAFFGREAMQKLRASRVALFGIGGVGGWCAEALARSGVGAIDLYDGDVVSPSNINRQIVALHSTLGRQKAEVMAERVRDINAACDVRAVCLFYDESTADAVDFSVYDYVIDAIDTVTSKVLIISRCKEAGTPVISCMGTGNKTDISSFRVADISQTSVCPLARAVRTLLRKKGITSGVKAVFSTEKPAAVIVEDGVLSRHIPASNAFAPAAAGLMLARETVLDLIKTDD